MKLRKTVVAIGSLGIVLAVPVEVVAQDELIVVTGTRSDRDEFNEYYDNQQSAIGLTRKADFFVKPIYINSDSRDATTRRAEVDAMLDATISLAREQGIALVAGDYTLKPLNDETREDLSFRRGSRPDTTRVTIYARIAVGGKVGSVDEADEIIRPFTKSVPVTGRSYIETGSTGLALQNPDQYRLDVIKKIAAEARSYAAQFGGDYGVEIRGLDSELFWQQASETEVFLYIEHSFVIKPK